MDCCSREERIFIIGPKHRFQEFHSESRFAFLTSSVSTGTTKVFISFFYPSLVYLNVWLSTIYLNTLMDHYTALCVWIISFRKTRWKLHFKKELLTSSLEKFSNYPRLSSIWFYFEEFFGRFMNLLKCYTFINKFLKIIEYVVPSKIPFF